MYIAAIQIFCRGLLIRLSGETSEALVVNIESKWVGTSQQNIDS